MEIIDINMFLAEQSGQAECYCYPNPGNAGDTLIAAATYQLFDALGIQYNNSCKNISYATCTIIDSRVAVGFK